MSPSRTVTWPEAGYRAPAGAASSSAWAAAGSDVAARPTRVRRATSSPRDASRERDVRAHGAALYDTGESPLPSRLAVRCCGRCAAGSPRSMCSPPSRCSATRWRWSSTPRTCRPRTWPASPTGRTCRRRPSSCRPRTPGPTTGSASSRRSPSCPFAGHPTLGTAHAWLEAGGVPAADGTVVQECGVGLVTIDRGERLAFAAPPLLRSGPADAGAGRAEIAAPPRRRRRRPARRRVGRQRAGLGRRPPRRRRRRAGRPARPSPSWTSASSGSTRRAHRRPSRSGPSSRRTGRWSRIRSPAASTPRWPSGSWAPVA